jgi:hypothetical protein
MNNVFEAYSLAIKNNTDNLRKLNDLLLKVVTLHTLHEDEDLMSGLDFIFYGNQILICSKVDKLSDIEPLLALLEKTFAVEFDKTFDCTSGGWRQFECKTASWLRVDAELKADGVECRRVVVGLTDPQPIFAFECGEVTL